jgi:signal transduction histidine kinase
MQIKPPEAGVAAAPFHTAGMGRLLNGSGVVAALVGCSIPLIIGIGSGWDFGHSALYTALALVYLALSIGYLISEEVAEWFTPRFPAYLLLIGLVLAGMQYLSDGSLIQPIAFTVPFVIAVLCLPPVRAAFTALFFLGLIVGAIWLSGEREPAVLLLPVAIYGAVMFFMFAIVRVTLDQDAARREAAQLAVENARLAHEAQQSATLAERNRIARELHDTIAQGLSALTMQIEAAQRSFDRDPERTRTRLARAHELARETLADVRRSVWTLASPIAEGAELERLLAEQAQRFSQRTGVPADIMHTGPPLVLPSEQAIQVVRIVQEVLQNIEKHAHASRVQVHSTNNGAGMTVCISDDGVGFEPDRSLPDGQGHGFGLIGLRERARLAAAELQLHSAIGQGTTIELRLPLAERAGYE